MRSDLFLLVCLVVGGIVYAAALALGNDYYLLRRLRRAAICRARDGLEHPRRLLRLREFRLGCVLRARRLFDGRDSIELYPMPIPVSGRFRRRGLRRRRFRHGLSDAAAARSILRHCDAGARGGAGDSDCQLGLCRRLARRLYRATRVDRAVSAATSDICS